MNQNALWVKFDQHRFVLGMEWRLLEDNGKVARSMLSKLHREGMYWYATRGLQDFIGTCTQIPKSRQPMHSAALHLASQWSQGGLELFVFGLADQRVAVIALNERRPVPGFDFIGSMSEAQALIEEFEAIQQGQHIRRVGDLGLMPNEEALQAQTVFDQPSTDSKLKKIPSLKMLLAFAGMLLVGLCALYGIYNWQVHEREDLLAAIPAPTPPDPNTAYNLQTLQFIKTIHSQGQTLHQMWFDIAVKLPLSHQGWVLTQIECKPENCLADWRRQYGSVDDFYSHLPPQTQAVLHMPVDKDALTQRLQTTHAIKVKSAPPPYSKLGDLPSQSQGFRNLSSWLQDLSTIGARSVHVEKVQVWNGGTDPALLTQPLLKGTWSAQLPLGVATNLTIPPFATVTQMQTALGVTYQLTGDYYVRADSP